MWVDLSLQESVSVSKGVPRDSQTFVNGVSGHAKGSNARNQALQKGAADGTIKRRRCRYYGHSIGHKCGSGTFQVPRMSDENNPADTFLFQYTGRKDCILRGVG
jgi:hypothetical protein